MNFEYLDTPRLRLRVHDKHTYRYAFEQLSGAELEAFFGTGDADALALERRRHEGGMETYRSTFRYFHLIEKASGHVIGSCGFHNWYPEHRRAEIGYALTQEEAKGKGLMREALTRVLQHGFEDLGLERVEALIGADNEPSLALARGAGFVPEGRLRRHWNVAGVLHDSLVFGLLKSEWEEKSRSGTTAAPNRTSKIGHP
ncbi:N-acetyltransferase [Flaviaesturariibacter flavus]|uniref:N-acetyltransferase n=1 Tax=Flaviaesturariibacter flavus TaxID=2502780 RepID=A0A4R1BAK5_9BACT|nr:GNAT family protein [Flaviaesturariibacter flavus]TCJ13974.1 N-acetyltransferase [Flaviaesturariibacter flavus]